MTQEEPVNENLEGLINELNKRYPEVSFAKLSRIAVTVSNWQKQQTIDKACKWLEPLFKDYAGDRYGVGMLKEFRKEMNE